ncbi:c-type cytochrome [Glaciimonas immobilis]|uniref:Cytochrome c553 n=1 Tax=Glaciimonas immobilis TaxID=728004 RepID=A0A840RXF3_9BURK|nr:c-type cytochrome [Glaciimonas immobilis]KAF3998675.1 cytochrome c4 [Glaciimonas immobilis]MBB5201546.1 cytochrome c553 [Glaciimonas immobilis]
MKVAHIVFAAITALSALSFQSHAADIEAGKKKAETCIACHGVAGNSTVPMFPVLAGQSARYLYLELRDFKEGARVNPMMSPMAANLSKEDMQDLAAYFAAQIPTPINFKADPAKVKLGFAKAEEVLCSMCHLGAMKGQNEIPKLSGQHYDYIAKQLTDFRARARTNDAGNMTAVTKNLTDDDIVNLSQYIANIH